MEVVAGRAARANTCSDVDGADNEEDVGYLKKAADQAVREEKLLQTSTMMKKATMLC